MQSEESNALVKLAKAVIEHAPEGATGFQDVKFSDIEAALSAAGPVAWQPRYKQDVIDHLRTVSDNVSEYAMTVFPTKDQAEEYGHGGHQVRPLYAAPALAVVAKELPYHCDVCTVPGYGDAPCSPLCDRFTLSAQVQDESEVIDCLLAGKPFVFDPATHFCHADDGGAPEYGIKYVPAAQVQDVP